MADFREVAPASESFREELEVGVGGSEVFTPKLKSGAVYRLAVQGQYGYTRTFLFFLPDRVADAVYVRNRLENFAVLYDGFRVNGVAMRALDSYEEDRDAHQYSCLLDGADKRVALTLWLPESGSSAGHLTVTVELMPSGTETARARQAREAQRAALRSTFGQRVEQLRSYVRQNGNFLDTQFCQDYLRKFSPRILTEHRNQWSREYQAIFADSELVTALTVLAPEVLEWHKRRLELILSAERAIVIVPPAEPLPPLLQRKITASTLSYAQGALTEVFRLAELYDRTRAMLAQDRNEAIHRPILEEVSRGIAFCYQELKRFGIDASTPEGAEVQFFRLCPPPAATYCEELIARIRSGEPASVDPIRSRVEVLFREELKLTYQRKRSVERKKGTERDAIDARLAVVQREETELKEFLRSIGCPVEFKDYREQETSVVEEFLKLHEGKKKILAVLKEDGDDEQAEQVEALYAQQRAKLFEGEESYT